MKNPITSIPVGLEMSVLMALTIALVVASVVLAVRARKHHELTRKSRLSVVLMFSALLPALLLASIQMSLSSANEKGLRYVKWQNMTLAEIQQAESLAPKMSKTPEDLSGSIVILYKFGCPDCEGIYPEMQKKLEGKENIYYVPSYSEVGKKLVEEGSIQEVPTGVYVRKNKLANGAAQNNIVLYTINSDGKPVLNEKALDRLLLLQEQGK